MTGSDPIVDWTLQQLPADQQAEVRRRLQGDPRAAVEAADVRALLEDMRTLTVEPSGRVPLAMRYAIQRRRHLRAAHADRARPGGGLRRLVRTTGVAAATLAGLLLWQERERSPARATAAEVAGPALPVWAPPPPVVREAAPSPRLPDDDVLAVGGASLQRHYAALHQLAEVDLFDGLMRADNELALLRLEFTQRYSPRTRRASIAACGGRPDLEDRIQSLAGSVAASLQERLRGGEATVADTALALRALLASGSTRRIGHRDAVAEAVEFLEARVARLEGGELATALAALTDFAVVSGGRAAALVAEHGERLAWSTQVPVEGRTAHSTAAAPGPAERLRPALLGFRTPVAYLADAGHVLQLAPAFGVHPTLAHRARLLIAAHLEERLAASSGERPDLLAAMLYGFGDLIERRDLDHRLLLWRPTLLAGQDLVALHHLSWSQFPPRPGWADFQRELRELATLQTPADMRDASALLLSLAMNYAAPGVHWVLDLVG